MSSNKTPTEVPNVYTITMGNGQKRLWCGACKKFLASNGGGFHTCDPNWRSNRPKSTGAKSKRRWKLTPKRRSYIDNLVNQAIRYQVLQPYLNSLVKKTKGAEKAVAKRLKGSMETKKINAAKRVLGFL